MNVCTCLQKTPCILTISSFLNVLIDRTCQFTIIQAGSCQTYQVNVSICLQNFKAIDRACKTAIIDLCFDYYHYNLKFFIHINFSDYPHTRTEKISNIYSTKLNQV